MNIHLGQMHAASFATDAKHLGFVLARYHFVSRMLRGAKFVLEVGCGDGTGAQIVKQSVEHLIGIDRDPTSAGEQWDILRGPFASVELDAVYALDVLEHIDPVHEDCALRNMRAHLKPHGTMIIGMPSYESQPYASELSRRYHVNCKTGQQMFETLGRHFHNIFLFGMQDMTLHTGFDQMCHYRLALCTGARGR